MHARIIHTGLKAKAFTPFRDIWIPLDLSNPASFNGVLAHAAADLVGSRGDGDSSEVLKFKTEAIEIINKWLGTTATAINDEVFAGVLRLLTFEVCRVTAERIQRSPCCIRYSALYRSHKSEVSTRLRLSLYAEILGHA